MAVDKINQELKVGDTVVCVAAYYHEIAIAKITKICPVKIKVKSIKDNGEWFVYPEGIVKISNLTPKPVINIEKTPCYDIDGIFEGYDRKGNCPNCNKAVYLSDNRACPECGQILKWGEI